jgi:uncharacterized RDD family membrane protein YckC
LNNGAPLVRGVQPRATFGQRFLAYLIDLVLLNVITWIVFSSGRFSLPIRYFLAQVISIAYFAMLEGGSTGQTLGKRFLGIRVVDFETGATIDRTRALVRNIGRLVSGLVLALGYLWMLWDRDRQTWHDKIASTTVVPATSFPIE